MMKRVGAVCMLLVVWAATVSAQERGFGLGISIGEPTGLNGKFWVSGSNAIDGGIAWSFRRQGFLHVHADYLWHFSDIARGSVKLLPYIGVGGRIGARNGGAMLGVRVPFGLACFPGRAPIDIFLEVAPVVDLAPATELQGNGGIGIRYYF
jgi:hypothetical protein